MFVKTIHQFFSHKNKKVDSPTYLNPSGGVATLEVVCDPLLIMCLITWAKVWTHAYDQ